MALGHAKRAVEAELARLQEEFASTTHRLCDRVADLERERAGWEEERARERREHEEARERERQEFEEERMAATSRLMEKVEASHRESLRLKASEERELWREKERQEQEWEAAKMLALDLLEQVSPTFKPLQCSCDFFFPGDVP